ncbi:Mg2+ Transporter-E (MgtE) Family, partial [Pseudoloma neurophilia]
MNDPIIKNEESLHYSKNVQSEKMCNKTVNDNQLNKSKNKSKDEAKNKSKDEAKNEINSNNEINQNNSKDEISDHERHSVKNKGLYQEFKQFKHTSEQKFEHKREHTSEHKFEHKFEHKREQEQKREHKYKREQKQKREHKREQSSLVKSEKLSGGHSTVLIDHTPNESTGNTLDTAYNGNTPNDNDVSSDCNNYSSTFSKSILIESIPSLLISFIGFTIAGNLLEQSKNDTIFLIYPLLLVSTCILSFKGNIELIFAMHLSSISNTTNLIIEYGQFIINNACMVVVQSILIGISVGVVGVSSLILTGPTLIDNIKSMDGGSNSSMLLPGLLHSSTLNDTVNNRVNDIVSNTLTNTLNDTVNGIVSSTLTNTLNDTVNGIVSSTLNDRVSGIVSSTLNDRVNEIPLTVVTLRTVTACTYACLISTVLVLLILFCAITLFKTFNINPDNVVLPSISAFSDYFTVYALIFMFRIFHSVENIGLIFTFLIMNIMIIFIIIFYMRHNTNNQNSSNRCSNNDTLNNDTIQNNDTLIHNTILNNDSLNNDTLIHNTILNNDSLNNDTLIHNTNLNNNTLNNNTILTQPINTTNLNNDTLNNDTLNHNSYLLGNNSSMSVLFLTFILSSIAGYIIEYFSKQYQFLAISELVFSGLTSATSFIYLNRKLTSIYKRRPHNKKASLLSLMLISLAMSLTYILVCSTLFIRYSWLFSMLFVISFILDVYLLIEIIDYILTYKSVEMAGIIALPIITSLGDFFGSLIMI